MVVSAIRSADPGTEYVRVLLYRNLNVNESGWCVKKKKNRILASCRDRREWHYLLVSLLSIC